MYGIDVLDFIILIFIILTIVIGFFRGSLKELLSLLVWVLSFAGALVGYGFVYGQIKGFHRIQGSPEFKEFWAFLALFLVLFTILSIIRFVITIFVSSFGMNIGSRFLGMVFGFIKSVFIIYICLMIVQNFVSKDESVLKRSVVLEEVKPYLVFNPKDSKDSKDSKDTQDTQDTKGSIETMEAKFLKLTGKRS